MKSMTPHGITGLERVKNDDARTLEKSKYAIEEQRREVICSQIVQC
jgi:hypothetical protein